MKDIAIYDKASYHYTAENYPQDLAESQAYVHTGFFLGWLIKNNLMSDSFNQDWQPEINDYLTGEITGPNLFEIIDGTLSSEDLNEDGNAFASEYFNFKNGARYTHDYEETFFEYSNLYAVEDTVNNFERISAKIDDNYRLLKENVDDKK